MSSHTELLNRLASLEGKLPDFSLPHAQTAHLLRTAAERMSTDLNRCLKNSGINENLWYSLLAVYTSPRREIMPSRLSGLLGLTRTSATRLSDEMVTRGWVERDSNSLDRRQIVLRLTPQGEAFINQMQPVISEKRSRIWQQFGESDHSELQRLLDKLISAIDN